MNGTVIAHPILTGSIYPVRAGMKKPKIVGEDGEYQLISEEKSTPTGLLARLFIMSAINRMVRAGETVTQWDNIHQVFVDMGTKESGSNLTMLKRVLQTFNHTIFSTPEGYLQLHIELFGEGIKAKADEKLVQTIQEQGVYLNLSVINKLRGRGIGGIPIDIYAWAIYLAQKSESRSFIPWSEIATKTALSNSPKLPYYFAKSLRILNQATQRIDAQVTKDGLLLI